jgi:uncharacterized protein (TIGR02246 family)
MKTVFKAVPLLLFAFTAPLAGQTTQPGDVAAAKRGIQAGNAAYIAAFKKADAKELSQVYDPKGARLNEGGQVVRGRDAIEDDVGKFVGKVGPVRVTLETKEVWLTEDIAYETGLWTYTFHPKGQAEQHIGGHYVTVWRRQPDAEWKILADLGVPGT